MNDRAYDRLANALMLVAVASALLFDAGVLPRIVIGALGGIAALASVYLYFSNQSKRQTSGVEQPQVKVGAEEKPGVPATTAGTSLASPQVAKELAAADRWVLMLAKREKPYVRAAYVLHHHRHAVLKASERAFYGGFLVHEDVVESNVILSPNDVAACTIEIIQQLSKRDGADRWEFHFGANGLRVSAKKGHAESDSASSHGDFDLFGQMPTTTVQ